MHDSSGLDDTPSSAAGALGSGKSQSAQAAESCPGTTLSGQPCRMRPTAATGRCMAHADSETRKARSARGGTLTQARKALARAKADAVERFGIAEPLPDLKDIVAIRNFIAATVEAVASRRLSPAAGNTLLAAARLGKDMLALELDVRLAEMLEEGR